jgi:hypothetical protein
MSASFTLAKIVRDNHEASRLRNHVAEAKTEKLLHGIEGRK